MNGILSYHGLKYNTFHFIFLWFHKRKMWMFHVEHPTFSTIMFFLVFSSVFQAAQERIPIAGFSACGIIPFRRMAIPAERFYVIGRTFL